MIGEIIEQVGILELFSRVEIISEYLISFFIN